MNLKNFPNKLNSKTSCLRIMVPENLDLALEGLIRKVLREQPKIDDIYAFAADYFDMLLKIRDKVGTKFSADQLCSFHNDEDAHEMVKLAGVFAKPGNLKTKFSEVEKTKNSDRKRKECSKSTGKSEKRAQNVKQPMATQRKSERMVEKKKNQQLHEAKLEKPEKLKLEPKTEDIGDDEEFLKSDSIKLLVEKELMDAAKYQSKDKEKERKDATGAQQNGKSQEAGGNEDFCAEVDEDCIKTELKKTGEITNKGKEEKTESQGAALNKKEDVKEEGEKKTLEEAIKETLHSTSVTSEGFKEQLRDNTKDVDEEANTETQNDNLDKNEIKIKNDHLEEKIAEEKTKIRLENVTEAKVIIKNTTHQEASKETTETQDAAKNTSLEEKMETEDDGKIKGAREEETQDNAKDKTINEPSLAQEGNLDPVELCSVVDILNIKPFEKDESNLGQVKKAKAEDKNLNEEEGINEVKIKTEVVINEEKEDTQTKDSVKAFEKSVDLKLANKVEEVNIVINSNEKEAQQEQENFIPGKISITEEPTDTTNAAEKSKMQTDPGNNKSDDKIAMEEEKIEKADSEKAKPVLSEDHKPTEDNIKSMQDNETAQISKVIEDVLAPEEKAVKKEPKTAIENEKNKGLEERLQFEENLAEASDHKEPLSKPDETKASKASKMQLENKNFNFAETVEDEGLLQNKTEDKDEEPIQNQGKTEELEEMNSVKNDQRTSGEPSNIIIKEQTNPAEVIDQPKVEEKLRNVEVKPKKEEIVKEVECKTEGTIDKRNYEKQTEKGYVTEAAKEIDIAGKVDRAVEVLLKESEKEKCQIMQESNKSLDEPEKKEIAKTNPAVTTDLVNAKEIPEQLTREAELNLTTSGDELCTVVDSQHVIKVEAEKLPEENLHSESVQVKTIQTHYYDTLQVPEQVTKEYRVHSVENGNVVDNTLNIANVVLSFDNKQVTEISVPPLDLPKLDDQEQYKKDLEDSLMTPSSNYSLNLSELSIQTISEMFLKSERQYSGLNKEERMNVTKTGEKCGDEDHMKKREVEETIHKTVVPSLIKATPMAPRDEAEINEEANVEPRKMKKNIELIEKKQEPSVDSNERADSSNEGRSIDSDTAFMSVEVKTVIETQNLEDEEQEKDKSGSSGGAESDVQIRIEATVDVPEGVIVNVREEKEYINEVTQHAGDEPSTSETVPKDSQTSSGESESTISSTVTEIKRNNSTKKQFSSTRTLITTQSLDLDKRNPLLKTRSLSSFRQGVIDFEVWNAIEKELEEAATKIQSNFRGYKTRKKLQRENAVHITTEESSCSTTPAEPEPELRERREQSTGEFHDSIVLSEYPR